MANSMQEHTNINFDFLILNGGGFRSTWYPGVIKYGNLFSMLPFDNTINSFKILGGDLKKLIELVQNGQKRYYPTWGLQQIFVRDHQTKLSGTYIHNKFYMTKEEI
jgi:2',3'-cyclic-nucleotide 2'-phosphodiesterase (5'-nucleotidase family)